jgi:hypothetical protein
VLCCCEPQVSIRMGDLDDDPEIRPQFHTFVDDPVRESELGGVSVFPIMTLPSGERYRDRLRQASVQTVG